MVTVRIVGWRAGMRKIDLTHLIRDRTALSLAPAKRCVDDVLDDRPVTLRFDDDEAARSFIRDAEALGALCRSGDGEEA